MRIARRLTVALASIALILSAVVAAPAATAAPDVASIRALILAQTNQHRAAAGLNPVIAMPALDNIAQGCSNRQAANNTMAHCLEYHTLYPAGWQVASENVAYGYANDAVVTGWMNSPGHRANILEPTATHLGIGIAFTPSGRPYYTQNFASYVTQSGSTFIDVSASGSSAFYSAFSTEIEWLAAQGVTTGYPAGVGLRSYQPWNGVTRDAMAAFLYRSAGRPAFTAPSASPFVDVATSHPFYKEIAWLASSGISTGWTVGGKREFRPTLQITRDAMAAFLYRYVEPTPPVLPSTSPFRDASAANSSFYTEIVWLSNAGISTGWTVPGGREFRPFNTITRDAMAAFLYRAASL